MPSGNKALTEPVMLTKIQGCQVLLNFSILLLKLRFCYWHFHEILAKILEFILISELFPHKNSEICVDIGKNTEIIAICYWSWFPEVGSPEDLCRHVASPVAPFTNMV